MTTAKKTYICIAIIFYLISALPIVWGYGDFSTSIRFVILILLTLVYSGICLFFVKWNLIDNTKRIGIHKTLTIWIVSSGFIWLFCTIFGSLLTIMPSITFNPFKFFFVSALQVAIAPSIAIFQIVLLFFCARLSIPMKYQPFWLVLPVVIIGFVMMVTAVLRSMPEVRFETLIGVPPPASAQNINYAEWTGLDNHSATIDCNLVREDYLKLKQFIESYRYEGAIHYEYSENGRFRFVRTFD